MPRKRKFSDKEHNAPKRQKTRKSQKELEHNRNTSSLIVSSINKNCSKDIPVSLAHDEGSSDEGSNEVATTTTTAAVATKMSALQQSYLERLKGSRFRALNEELYTTPSQLSLENFSKNPQLFTEYHAGFQAQVQSWPVNPVDIIYKSIIKNTHTKTVVADFGCGQATLAKRLLGHKTSLFEVHSFDLVSPPNSNPYNIIACDMANVPLPSNSVHVAVFCLSLMGINCADFIREAHRVLCNQGILKIAEVRSRFEQSTASTNNYTALVNNKNIKKQHKNKQGVPQQRKQTQEHNVDQTLLTDFLSQMKQLGFRCSNLDRTNQMFILMDFTIIPNKVPSSTLSFSLKKCVYKRR